MATGIKRGRGDGKCVANRGSEYQSFSSRNTEHNNWNHDQLGLFDQWDATDKPHIYSRNAFEFSGGIYVPVFVCWLHRWDGGGRADGEYVWLVCGAVFWE